ncbi:hypothetical protein N0V87_007274 [Didymella glomerata]|uniref:Uncharacterized protein n=1 Tax=Didymella glomerata TaxID=749621 RepID=A0A9W8WW03_9PLEO|nr:hypothetical protein N0V87_007274 [Didymella glomerata]
MTAYACRSEYTMAKMPVRVLSTTSGLTVDFNKERFSQVHAPVSAEIWNLTSLHELNASPEWYEYIPQPYLLDKYISGGNPPALHGAAALLGVKYDWNITTMMSATDLPQEAAKLRRRFFAETLRTSMDYQGASNVEPVSGERVASERRILVNKPIAISKFFIYRANIEMFRHDASFSPFAVIPTFLAVGVTLWWDSIDQACRALQPYLAISHDAETPSRGIGLSYASSFWLWASAKAAKNRHWLLSLVTLTTFMMQALTISMSALFQQNSVKSLSMVTTLGYWTENRDSINVTTRDFTAKWVRGKAGFREVGDFAQNPRMVFREPPAIQVLNCVPVFETADAEVTVEPSTGAVQEFDILGDPAPDAVAWSDNFQLRRSNESTYQFHNSTETRRFYHNITTSYGTLFMKSLLRAACLENINYNDKLYSQLQRSDYLFDKIFNMRDNSTGLNVDFMSYAALAQVDHDPAALLDPETLIRETQKIFSMFFQHYVSGAVSLQKGGWVYQPIGSDLKLTEPIPNEALHQPLSKFEDFPLRNTERMVTATLYTQTEVLQMNVVAFWVSVGIMIWLIVTILIFAAMQRRYLGGMQRNIECVADVLVIVAGSERLLQVIQEKGVDKIVEDDVILTRLGWFRDPDGTMRWRIELVEEREGQGRSSLLSTAYAPVPRDDEVSGSIVPSTEV